MNWKKYFGGREAVTAAERQKLEQIDQSVSPQTEALEFVKARFSNSYQTRLDWIRQRSKNYADAPTTEKFDLLIEAVGFNPDPRWAQLEGEIVTGDLHAVIDTKRTAGYETIRAIYRRELTRSEDELNSTRKIAKAKAEELGIEYTPDSIIVALERRVLDLRNAVEKKQFAYWREELAGLL
jgi:hypothetical protein